MVSEKRILELQQIIKDEYGLELDFHEASEIATNLVAFYSYVYKLHEEANLQ